MIGSIPASFSVQITPSVLSAGGTALDLIGLILTNSNRVPVGGVPSFPSLAAVNAYFGVSSAEAALASTYFLGFDNSNKKPGALLFAQYPASAVAAYLRGGSVAAMPLATLQGLSGSLTLTVDGVSRTASTVSLASATSPSAAASLMQTALDTTEPTEATFTGAIAGTVLTVSAVASGVLVPGQLLSGAGITGGTTITALGTGTGALGTYSVSTTQTVASEAMTATDQPVAVAYDSTSGAFVITSGVVGAGSTIGYATGTLAASLMLTQATGAVISAGSAQGTPAATMNAVTNVTDNWCAFMTAFEPSLSDKLAFAAWTNGQSNNYLYACWDSDVTATQSGASGCFGALNKVAGNSGTAALYNTPAVAAFLLGFVASLDFTENNGRATAAYKSQSGLAPTVFDITSAANLIANGYSYYGQNATANQQFDYLYPGQISGKYLWIDGYVNQIWFSNQLQLALEVLLTQAKSIPYNIAGYDLIKAACLDPIYQAGNYGVFRPGVTLSQSEAAQVDGAAGLIISPTLSRRGWYLQILDALPQVRSARGSPPCTLYYVDGGSVQTINLAAVEVQ